MFYRAAVLKKCDIIGCGLNAQDNLKFIIHFDRAFAHAVFDTAAFEAHVVTIAHFLLIITVQFSSEKSGNVVRLYGMNGQGNQIVVDGLGRAVL